MVRRFYSIVLVMLSVYVSACGFTPVHGTRQQATFNNVSTMIQVSPVTGRFGQIFTTSLQDQLNPTRQPITPRYRLDTNLSIKESSIAIERDRTVTRYQISAIAHFTLTDTTTNSIIRTGTLKRENGYDRSDSEYATFISNREAANNAIEVLAKDVSQLVISSIAKKHPIVQ